jgi:X-Pro dipeptidyl-peptidase
MGNLKRRVGLAAAAVAATRVVAPPALAQTAPVLEGGKTAPVFGYADAIRERVFIESPYDSDKNGVKDVIAVDIKRPKATAEGLKAPVIMDPSPYYSTLGRGNESQLKRDYDGDGLLDLWPLFYDNYFVPRGYAVVLMDMIGTNNSTGCPTVHDESDNLSAKVVIDWLNGRTKGVDKDGDEVLATWHNGKSGLIGKSYDGTLANAVAASGVEGLATIVPISAIASYYDYTRTNGVIQRGNNYLASLANTVTNPDRRAHCAPIREELNANDGDETGDYSDFWAVRDYLKDLDKVKASVFITHGVQDENVRADHFSKWWYGLKERGVPRKLWIQRQGHVDPFDGRREVWVDTIHRWFDHWLYSVPNGIMNEPAVDIEVAKDVWERHADYPVPGTQTVDVYLQSHGATQTLGGSSGGTDATTTFRDNNLSENNYLNLNSNATQRGQKRIFLSPPLKQPLRLSGTAIVELQASLSKTQSNLTAFIVDYGPSTQVTRSGDGVSTPADAPVTCWGASVPDDTGCFKETTKPTQNVTQWRVSKGMMDSSNRNSLRVAEPVTIGAPTRFTWPMLPEDFTFAAGHRVGIVIGANFSGYGSTNGMTQTDVTIDTKLSKIKLPLVGGYSAAVAAGLFGEAVEQPVGGTVAATLSLSLGAPATFGAFTPGTTKEYEASTTANVISTAGDATLSVSDPGHLTNGAFSLPEPLRVAFSKTTWTGPTSNEAVDIAFKQLIKAGDPLRTGSYSRTLTFTLSTTNP